MKGFLLDTNVVSELRKRERCDPGVRFWFEQIPEDKFFISVLVLGDIRRGIERIRGRDRRQADALESWLESITQGYQERILPVDLPAADRWGAMGVDQPIAPVDGLLAATALRHFPHHVSRRGAEAQGRRRRGREFSDSSLKPGSIRTRTQPAGRYSYSNRRRTLVF